MIWRSPSGSMVYRQAMPVSSTWQWFEWLPWGMISFPAACDRCLAEMSRSSRPRSSVLNLVNCSIFSAQGFFTSIFLTVSTYFGGVAGGPPAHSVDDRTNL